jgi:hypothetical protein
MHRSTRGCAVLGAAIFVILMTGAVVAGCSGGDSPTAPDAPPTQNPPPPPPTVPAGLALSGVSLSQTSVQGQQQSTGVVTLTTAAPSSGVVVQLSSSNPTVAQVPETVMVVGGQTSASFLVRTSTVPTNSTSTITATFNGASRTAALTVMAPGLEASFTVSSPSKGTDGCTYGPGNDETDCVLDASNSRGFVSIYRFTYWTGGAPIGHSTDQTRSAFQLDTDCRFFDNGRGGDDPNGNRYVQMTVEMVVEDRVGTRSAPVRRNVRLYPNRKCGFQY